MEEILDKYNIINHLNVSRETCLDFERYISMIQEKNHEINIISKKTSKNNIIRDRHIIDSAQIVDFIDLNTNTTCDLGAGAGFPGIVLAIMIKNLNKKMKIKLFEKSYHKSVFLEEVSEKLNLNTEVLQKDIFEIKKLKSENIISRAFKPLPIILKLVRENFDHYENLILFMGKSGKKILKDVLQEWEFDYREKKSLTNEDSFLIKIKNIRKKIN